MLPNAAAISVNVPAGVYFLKVDGVGKGDLITGFSDYDSLGQYQLTGSYAASPYLPPVSVPYGTPLSGYAPLNVSFSSSGSSDPDGTVVSYNWNFGDGTSSTSPNPAHTYVYAGTYAAVLTVTDSQGLTSANSLTVYAAQDLFANTLHIGSIGLQTKLTAKNYQCVASVLVNDNVNGLVNGAAVNGNWSGVTTTGTVRATTATNGLATFTSTKTTLHGTCTFTVSGVTLTGKTYDSSQNTETKDSLTY